MITLKSFKEVNSRLFFFFERNQKARIVVTLVDFVRVIRNICFLKLVYEHSVRYMVDTTLHTSSIRVTEFKTVIPR